VGGFFEVNGSQQLISGECRTKFDVTPVAVSGHFSCADATAYNKETGQMGKVNIEVDFNATS